MYGIVKSKTVAWGVERRICYLELLKECDYQEAQTLPIPHPFCIPHYSITLEYELMYLPNMLINNDATFRPLPTFSSIHVLPKINITLHTVTILTFSSSDLIIA